MRARSLRSMEVNAVFRINPSQDSIHDLCILLTGYIDEEVCLKNPVERAKALINYMSDSGIEASYSRADPNVFIINTRELPEELRGVLEEAGSNPIKKVLGFSPGDITYEFYKGEETHTPYAILYKRPYKCEKEILEVPLYYESPGYRFAFNTLLRYARCEEGICGIVKWVPRPLQNLEQLIKDDSVKVAIIHQRERESDQYLDLARVKEQSYRDSGSGYAVSHLQLINGKKLICLLKGWKGLEPRKRQYYARVVLANILTSVYYKSGCVPFHVKLPHATYNQLLRNSLIVGIGISRAEGQIYKGAAVVMTGYGEVIARVWKDFWITKGPSYEFNKNEIEKFRSEIERYVKAYTKRLGESPQLLAILRSRMFLDIELEELLGGSGDAADGEGGDVDEVEKRLAEELASGSWWENYFHNVLVMSVYKTKYAFGRDVAVLASSNREKSSGVWYVQLKKQKYATQIVWKLTGGDEKLPLAAYLYIRALDFTSLHQFRMTLFPTRAAHRYLRWATASKQWHGGRL